MKHLGAQQEQVEKYLLNQLSEAEKAAFQTELLFDKDLQREVKKVREIQKIAIAEKRQSSTKNQYFKVGKWLLSILGVAIICSYFILSSNTNKVDSTNKTEQPKEDIFIPVEEKKQSTKTISPSLENTKELPKSTLTPAPPKSPPIQKKEESKSAPIKQYFAANYAINKQLEAELSANFRGDFEFDIQSPKKEQTYHLKDGEIIWALAGTLETEKVPTEDFDLIVEVYTNKKEDYENENPYLTFPLKLEEVAAANFNFSSNHQFKADARLFYYLIKDDLSGAILKAGKFSVK